MDQKSLLLSTAYLPPVEYFTNLVSASEILIEQHEYFIKQTYRNRCVIFGANGPVDLVIPVEKGRRSKTAIKDIRIYNEVDWQRNHWRTIFSAYNSSPFFEYYEDDLKPFYKKKWDFLFDFNNALFEVLNEILEISPAINFTTEFEKTAVDKNDLRNNISPKVKSSKNFEPYTQVFDDKFGFIPNLSIIDLIFNKGPESMIVLEK